MSKHEHPRTLQRKLILSFLGLTILLSLSISISSYFITYRVLRERISSSYSFTLDHIANSVAIETNRIEYLSNYVFVDKTIKEAIRLKDENSYESMNLNYDAFANLKHYFIAHNLIDINSVSILGANGFHLFYYSNLDEQVPQVIPEIMAESAVLLDESGGGTVWTGIKKTPYGNNAMTVDEIRIYRTIKNEGFTEDIGFMFISVKPHLFSKLIKIDDLSFPDFAQKTGVYITHENSILVDSGTLQIPEDEVLHALQEDAAKTMSGYHIPGSEYIAYVKEIKDTPWHIVGVIPTSLIHVDNAYIFWTSLLAFSLCILICALVWLYFSSTIFKPLRQLSSTIKQIEAGDKDIRAEVNDKDEIGILSHNFNSMLDTNELLYQKNLQKEMEIKEAQYQRLQAQINPHFLYNTLNSIRWMAIMCKADNIKLAIDAFWAISKYNFKTDEKYTTIGEEISIIRQYIYLQKIAYKNAFSVAWEVDESLLPYQCIKFFLQPLIENAIKHGILQSGRMGTITIKVFETEGYIHFIIHDTGTGMDDEKIMGLLNFENSRSGLSNVLYRLDLAYGESYTIDITGVPDQFTRFDIAIPKEELKHD